MKIALVIGAGEEAVYGIHIAKENGYYVIAFDGNPKAKGLYEADEFHIVDIRTPENIIEKIKKRKPDIIIPVPIGRILVSSCKVAEYYNLKYVSSVAGDLCTDKYLFHQKLFCKGLRNAEVRLLKKGDLQLNEYPTYYPVIIKPRFGSGSRAVKVIDDENSLKVMLKEEAPYNEDMLVEQAVQGIEYGVDGIITDSYLSICLLREKIITNPPARQCVGYIQVAKKDSLYESVGNYIKDIINELELNDCVFHADVIVTGSEIFCVEISPRPSGHNLHNCFTIYASGRNLIQEYIDYVEERKKEIKEVSTSDIKMISYFDFENCEVIGIPNEQKIKSKYPILEYVCNISKGYMEPVMDGSTLMNRGYYILYGKSKEECLEIREAILGEFNLI